MKYKVVRLRRPSAAVEAVPEKKGNLDLYGLEERLRSEALLREGIEKFINNIVVI